MFLREMMLLLGLLILPSSVFLQDPGRAEVDQEEEFYKQLQDLDQMISLVRNARSVSLEQEEDEDDEELMEVLDMVDLDDSSNVEAVADVMKTLDGGKQMEFLMTRFMVRRQRRDDGEENYPAESVEEEEEEEEDAEEIGEEVEEDEPMLSRQRRFISDMFSYFTGDSGDSKTEPEPENIHYPQQPWPESAHEPSYPVKPNQHRHYRSPHPEPEPEGILVGSASSVCLFYFLFIMKVPILLCYMKVPGRWAMRVTCPKMIRAAVMKTKLSTIIIREAAWTSYPRRNLSSTWSPDWTEEPRPVVLTCSLLSIFRSQR